MATTESSIGELKRLAEAPSIPLDSSEIERMMGGYRDGTGFKGKILSGIADTLTAPFRWASREAQDKASLAYWTFNSLGKPEWATIAGGGVLTAVVAVHLSTGWPFEPGAKADDIVTGKKSSQVYKFYEPSPTPSPVPTVSLVPLRPAGSINP